MYGRSSILHSMAVGGNSFFFSMLRQLLPGTLLQHYIITSRLLLLHSASFISFLYVFLGFIQILFQIATLLLMSLIQSRKAGEEFYLLQFLLKFYTTFLTHNQWRK